MENMNLVRIDDDNPSYTSMQVGTRAEKKAFFNAVENPQHKLSKFINKKIVFNNVYMTKTQIMQKDEDGNPTGEINETIKTILVTPDGEGIISTSMGVARSLMSMFEIFGTPDTWDINEPMECYVRQVEIGKNRTFKLEVC